MLHSFAVSVLCSFTPSNGARASPSLYVSLWELGKGKLSGEKRSPLYAYGWKWPAAEEEEEKLATCRRVLIKTKLQVLEAATAWFSLSFNTNFYLEDQEPRRETESTGDFVFLEKNQKQKTDITLNGRYAAFRFSSCVLSENRKKSLKTL